MNRPTFCYKTGRLIFNIHGISIIYKSQTNKDTIRILLISIKNNKYIQQPITIQGTYTVFIQPIKIINIYDIKNYYFYYWKCNIVEQQSLAGLEVTEEELNNLT